MAFCRNCGHEIVGAGVFCQACGTRADTVAQQARPQEQPLPGPRQASFYTGSQVVQQNGIAGKKRTNPLGWLLSATAASWLLAYIAYGIMRIYIHSGSVQFNFRRVLLSFGQARWMAGIFCLIIAANLLAAVVVYIVWQRSKHKLKPTAIAAAAVGVVLALVLYFTIPYLHAFLWIAYPPMISAFRNYLTSYPLAALNLALGIYLLANGKKAYFVISRAAVALLPIPVIYFAIISGRLPITGGLQYYLFAEAAAAVINVALVVKNRRRQAAQK